MGLRLQLPPMLAATMGALLVAGLVAAPAPGAAEAPASTRRHGHDDVRSARSWTSRHRQGDYRSDRPGSRHRHARDHRPPRAWTQRRHRARDRLHIDACVAAAGAWSWQSRARHRVLVRRCLGVEPRRPGRPIPVLRPPARLVRPAAPPRPLTASTDEPPAVAGAGPTPSSRPIASGMSGTEGSPTTVCEPTTTSTRPPRTSGPTTTTSTTTTGTTTTTTTTPPTTDTTSGTATSGTSASTSTTTTGPPPTRTGSAGGQPTGRPSYEFPPAVPPPSNGGPTSSDTMGTSGGVSPTGPNEAGGSATTTVCEPAGGRLPSTGSDAAPLLLAAFALFASGLGVLLAVRSRSAH
jgi:LPXTG-motif cell wall-anchored protein